jgi:HAD superfamily hydrolase (TIGR01549 family)
VSEIRALLLDFGGTLDSAGKHWSTQFAESFAQAGWGGDRSTLDGAFLATDRAIAEDPRAATMALADYARAYVRRMLALLDPPVPLQVESIAEHFVCQARSHLRASAARLASTRGRFRLAVVSNFTANLPIILSEVGLAPLLDAVVCSAIEGVKKPDASIFRVALERVGVPAAQAVMIGDSLGNDIAPAKQLGLTTVWQKGDRTFTSGRESDADYVVSSFEQAIDVVCEAAEGGR